MGDVNISAILDSFSVSYDKRVRPNYGGEYRCVSSAVPLSIVQTSSSGGSVTVSKGDLVAIIHTYTHSQSGWGLIDGLGVGCLATRSISPDRHSARSR